ncbi:hypothetical protein A2Z22_04240 [Candidatus Woesebacteria bacterium RBG_16_34_12]|uniref:Uncharacterized protein n=1 Tax=Candidatus Woesebacteria bacterium RBG_16_34_12 TaxID=1802480 RepID=A0A1F7X8H4_9BACT|nr:MAG: hypothetical protein A2Z22_04240 [Candidatus Woesebacteria bacterium RBG_16_34_12]
MVWSEHEPNELLSLSITRVNERQKIADSVRPLKESLEEILKEKAPTPVSFSWFDRLSRRFSLTDKEIKQERGARHLSVPVRYDHEKVFISVDRQLDDELREELLIHVRGLDQRLIIRSNLAESRIQKFMTLREFINQTDEKDDTISPLSVILQGEETPELSSYLNRWWDVRSPNNKDIAEYTQVLEKVRSQLDMS